jgi:hypothetical protein
MPLSTAPYTGPFPRKRHWHRCETCRARGSNGVNCYKTQCTKPRDTLACGWCHGAALPTMETVAADRAAAASEAQGVVLAERLHSPLPSISRTTGLIETRSPLFSESAANPQQLLF